MSDRQRAGLWMLGSIASFTIMAISGREISFELDTFEIMTYRSIVGFVVVVAVGVASNGLRDINTRNMRLHTARNIAHFAGQNLWFFAIAAIPLAQVFSLEFLSPIWAIFLAPLILGEPIRRAGVVAAGMGFAGILIILRPGATPLSPGLIAAASCGIGFALSALLTRKLTRTANITCILFWMTLMQIGFGIVCAGIDGSVRLPSLATLPWLVLVGLAGVSAHFCLTSALKLAPAGLVMPFDFARLPVIALIAAAFYGEALDPWVFAGASLIILGNVLNLRATRI